MEFNKYEELELEKDVFDSIKEAENKRKQIEYVRKRANKVGKMFLFTSVFAPLITLGLLGIIVFIESFEDDQLLLISITLLISSILQLILSMFMYLRYKKISKLEDSKLVETSFYKSIQNMNVSLKK